MPSEATNGEAAIKKQAYASDRAIIGVHLDLKGMNFKPAYHSQYLADLASQGVNALLVEYEDTFPFHPAPGFGDLDIAADRTVVWSRSTVRRFQSEAAANGIEIIPLQQCLGHLEYLLGWKSFRHLAENREYPSTIRVDDTRAWALVDALLRQVISGADALPPALPRRGISRMGSHALRSPCPTLARWPGDLST